MNERKMIYLDDAIRIASGYCHPANIESELRKLPPAQPDLDEWCYDCKEYDTENHCCPRWNRVIRNTMKDAQPKQGHWIEIKYAEEVNEMLVSNYECSECHDWERYDSNFCPNCGAKMRRGEQDGNQ